MWLPGARAATQGRPYTHSQVVECTNLLWFDLVLCYGAGTIDPARGERGCGSRQRMAQRDKCLACSRFGSFFR
jgi:hypothetical protein